MKKSFFMIGLAAVFLSACSENDDFQGSTGETAIGFDTYVGKQTRATVTNIDNLNKFGVYAYVTASTPFMLMENEGISKSGEGWTYTNIKYWPENDKVNFFAYAPYKPTLDNYSEQANSFGFTVLPAASDQEDLIAATAFQKDKTTAAGKVNLAFKHLLSRIGFSAKTNMDYSSTENGSAKITVTGLEVLYKGNSVNSQGTFQFATTGDSGSDVEAGSWTALADDQFLAGNSGQLITNNVGMSTSYTSLNTAAQGTTAPATYLMMLPQTVAKGDLQAKITYTVDYENPVATVTNTVTVDLPEFTWAMGKAYTYNFDISLSQIVFGFVTVGDWADGVSQPGTTPAP